jgi:succinate dehydrogenase/fumarate reductase flavoprotein subunit
MKVGESERIVKTDVLVIGGGMAGMFAAIKARGEGLDVTLTDKGYVGKSGSTAYAEGDILFFRKAKDNLQEWVDIISKRVEYLNNRAWDEICLTEAEDRYNDLVSYGVEFWEKDGKQYKWDTSAVGAPPSVYQDITMVAGKYAPTLRKKVLDSGVRVLDNVMMVELLRQGGAVAGAVGFHVRGGGLVVVQAGAVVISTGTVSFKHDTSPTYFWTGDGEAMAYRAGAELSGREFNNGYLYGRREFAKMQEAATGEISGEVIRDSYEHPFALGGGYSGWYSRPTLNSEGGPVVTPAWEAHMGRAPLYLDSETIPPKKWEWLREYFKRIPVAYEMGDKIDFDVFRGGKFQWPSSRLHLSSTYAGCGIWVVDTDCASGVPGLYSAGNSSATMGSGAMYSGMGFGSNHAMVTGTRAGLAAAKFATGQKQAELDETEVARAKGFVRAPLERKGGFGPAWVTQVIQSITVPYFYLGVKHGERLRAALTIAEFVNGHLVPKLRAADPHEWRLCQETRNMALAAEMKLRASLYRTESRGDHFREDYPRRDDPEWLVWVKIKDDQGGMKLYKEPVPKEWWPDLTKPYEERYPGIMPLDGGAE